MVRRTVSRKGFRPQTWTFGWNAQDQLVLADGPNGRWRYGYDPFGRRIFKECAGHREDFLWDGDVVARAGAVDWFFEPDSFRPMARVEHGQLAYVVNDHLGTPKEVIAERGALIWAADHDTWGTLRLGRAVGSDLAEQGDYWIQPTSLDDRTPNYSQAPDSTFCPIRFQGQWEDLETGLLYNRFRYYDSLVGQYASPDPIGLLGGLRSISYVPVPTKYVDFYALTCNLPDGQRYVYRALAAGEDISRGLFARCCKADITPEVHVAGAKDSNWISATKDPSVAHSKYNKGNGVVSIDLCQVKSEVLDISRGDGFVNDFIAEMAIEDSEVLIRGYVPPEALRLLVK